MANKTLSFRQIFNLNFGFFGVQIAYALQSANISRIFATLGADPHQLSFFWILPPLMGMIVQPLIGKWSDKTWCRLGRRKPYSVVLFDEIEKAHPDVMNILLQILDDGRITDAQGRTVNFENTIIIMTTNAGSNNKSGSVGFGGSLSDMSRERTMKALNEFLRPEFINRVDEVICFNQLTEENFRAIAGLMLGEVRDVLAQRNITLTWQDSLIDYLVEKAYSVTYGARNLRRVIQKDIEDVLAARIIEKRGEDVRHIDLSAADGQIQIEMEG